MFSALIKVVRWTGNKARILCGISLVSAPAPCYCHGPCGFLGLSRNPIMHLRLDWPLLAQFSLRAALMWLRNWPRNHGRTFNLRCVLRIRSTETCPCEVYFDNHPSRRNSLGCTPQPGLSFVEIPERPMRMKWAC